MLNKEVNVSEIKSFSTAKEKKILNKKFLEGLKKSIKRVEFEDF